MRLTQTYYKTFNNERNERKNNQSWRENKKLDLGDH